MKIDPFTLDRLRLLRHELHQYPELSGQELDTAGRIHAFLEPFSPTDVLTGIGGYGVAAVFDSGQPGPTVMFRCELDALPIPEIIPIPYQSLNYGVSHKCGHDGHMSIVAGLAPLIHQKPLQQGRVVLLFQPAEETGEGAVRVVGDPAFERVRPDYVFALHNMPGYAHGDVILRNDVFAAGSRGMIVQLTGETSHAAHPEAARSPAFAMAEIIQALDRLSKQRGRQFNEFYLITIVHARLGERAFGVTPGYAEVMATFRTFDDKLIEKLTGKAEKTIRKLAEKHGLDHTVTYTEVFPTTVNNREAVDVLRRAVREEKLTMDEPELPVRWSEDFGNVLQHYPGAIFGLGAGKDQPQLHHSAYDFPDQIIEPGLRVFANVIHQVLDW
jgi:amidohydrolase